MPSLHEDAKLPTLHLRYTKHNNHYHRPQKLHQKPITDGESFVIVHR